MGEDFVTVRIKELARNFGDRIVGTSFVALGIVANIISYPRHHFTIMAENKFLSYQTTKCTVSLMHDSFTN